MQQMYLLISLEARLGNLLECNSFKELCYEKKIKKHMGYRQKAC